MRKLLQFGFGMTVIFLAASLAQPAIAQRGFGMQRVQQRQRGRRPFPPPPKWVENLRNMSPEEQARFMQNDARFRNLPPERQEQIRTNLARWNQLTPQQRDALRTRAQIFNRLTPEERAEVQRDLLPRWQK